MSGRPALVVEVQGTWLENIGARQLLDAVVAELHDPPGGVELAIDPCWGPYGARRELGLLQIAPRAGPGAGVVASTMAAGRRVVPATSARLMAGYGLVARADVGGLVDASGFALSDQWGARKAAQRWRVVRGYARRGRPIVLLPQAMGPFRDPRTVRAARAILTAADVVWVRDRRSLEHAQGVVGDEVRVRVAPDVTILEPGGPVPGRGAADVVVVPNARVVDRGGWAREAYLEAMLRAGRVARTRGRLVEVLLHTSERGDLDLARALADALGCALVHEPDPRQVKGRLGAAEVVVSSRYHAVLAALGQGVPAVAVGWSHKYEALYEDFGIAELVAAPDDQHALAGMVGELLVDAGEVRRDLAAALPPMLAAVDEVWAITRDVLGVVVEAPRPPDSGDVEHALQRDARPLGGAVVHGDLVHDLAAHQ